MALNKNMKYEKCYHCGKEFNLYSRDKKYRDENNIPYNICDDCLSKDNPGYDENVYIDHTKTGVKRYWDNPENADELRRRLEKRNITQKEKREKKLLSMKNQILNNYQSNTNEKDDKMIQEILSFFDNIIMSDELKRRDESIEGITSWRYNPDELSDEINKLILSDDKRDRIRNFKEVSKRRLFEKFEEYFFASYISNSYYFEPDIATENDGNKYIWDYAIYSKRDKSLQMVVDVCKERIYDEDIFLSVPDNVKYCIIYEKEFTKTFEQLVKLLMVNYNEFVLNMFHICRLIDFPYPKYKETELIASYKHLLKMPTYEYDKDGVKVPCSPTLHTRIADRLINHFHESIYHARRESDKVTPYQAWQSDELLIKIIKNRIVYVNKINPYKILQGFNIAKKAQKVSVFSAGRAKLIINKYLNEYDTIFDPFSGFSGRMLGALSLNKSYIGQDINEVHVNESKEIVEFLSRYYPSIKNRVKLSVKNIMDSYGEYECLFTCSPYNDKEIWVNNDEIGLINKSCDEWIDICLNNFKCNKYVFVVDKTERYSQYIVEEIINKSHFGCNKEYIIMIRR